MEKQEIISELYSIRAGLSLISENADIINQSEEKIISLKDQEKESYNSYQTDKNRLSYMTNQIKEEEKGKYPLLAERRKFEEYIATEKTAMKDAGEKAESKAWSRLVPFLSRYDTIPTIITNVFLMAVSGFVFVILCGILGNIIFGDDSWSAIMDEQTMNRVIVFSLIGGMIAYWLICLIVFLCKKKKIIQDISDEIIKDHTTKINRWQIEIDKIDLEIEKYDKKIHELSVQKSRLEVSQQAYTSRANIVISSNNASRELCKTVIDHCVKENIRIRDFLTNNYNVLTVADWPNIDLIIFYFNTGRADTMKEALQLVDEQRRNDAIVHAINSASREISGTIQRNFNNLSSMLSSHFSRINMQIEDMSFRVDKLGNEMRGATELLGGQISKLAEVNRLQTAFMRKAAKSTAELVEDMDRSIDVKVTVNY